MYGLWRYNSGDAEKDGEGTFCAGKLILIWD